MAAFEKMQQGVEALKAKRFDEAEEFLLAAFQAYTSEVKQHPPGGLDARLTICCQLGRVYRLTARYDEAIAMLERSLPLPASFDELVSVFRFLAKVAQQEDDKAGQREWYRRMFCLATINDSLRSMTWAAKGEWLRAFLGCHRSLYVYKWTGEPVPGDTLLSGRDYAVLKKINTEG